MHICKQRSGFVIKIWPPFAYLAPAISPGCGNVLNFKIVILFFLDMPQTKLLKKIVTNALVVFKKLHFFLTDDTGKYQSQSPTLEWHRWLNN